MNDIAPIAAAVVSLAGSVVVGLVAWGWRGEVSTLRAELGTVHAQMETLRAEVRAAIAEAGVQFYRQVNGTYTKTTLCEAVREGITDRIDRLEDRVNQKP
jgi:hypothetical protein